MFKLGLTGGIGSGKTVASDYFAQLGIEVVDTDVVARQVVEPGTPALDEIKAHFGADVIRPDGTLDRKALRAQVFADENERIWLESLLHPLIRKATLQQLESAHSAYVILVSPLLIESDRHRLADRVLVIDSPEALQLSRAQHRDGSEASQIKAIMQTQFSREQRLAQADDVVINDADITSLQRQLDVLHTKYLALATAQEDNNA